MKTISFTVTNDLAQDQRMNRICSSLQANGYAATLIGRTKRNSKPLLKKTFQQQRVSCFFEKGKLFYLEYNFRLFFVLLFSKYDAFCAIDLDTILPNYLVAKLKNKPIIYDAHEYFTEVEEVVNRPFTKWIWKVLEKWIVPQVKHAYTVSEGYKKMFDEEYNTNFSIIRNATVLKVAQPVNRKEKYILYQGAVNYGRGLEQLISAMQYVDGKLVVCGDGDILLQLKQQVKEMKLAQKVVFTGFLSPEKLVEYTKKATIGTTLFANAGLSNQHSLANRFFDYMHASVPQIAMEYPEYQKFNNDIEVAILVPNLEEKTLVEALIKLLTDVDYYNKLKENCTLARQQNNWQEEEKKLIEIYKKVF